MEDKLMRTSMDLKTVAKEGLRGKWGQAIGALLLTGLVSGIPLCSSAMAVGYSKYNLKVVRKENSDINDIFDGFNVFGKSLWLSIITAFFVYLWTLLLFIPGIVKTFAYSMSQFILAENHSLTAREALKNSISITNGKKGKLFYLYLSFIGWFLLGSLSFGIGYLWIIPYFYATIAAFYEDAKIA
jgi:uncharacterized membrane protein